MNARLLNLLAVFFTLAATIHAVPRISEFMADNKDTLADEDGDFSDWIEIYNPDAAPLNLTGYTLSDDPALPAKWAFPGVVLPSGGHLIVFASGKNRNLPAGTLHTNFSLEKNGDNLAFRTPGGVVLSEFAPYPPQETDRSYGSAAPLVQTTYFTQGATSRHIVPAANIANWNQRTFNDAAWTASTTGIGYERSPGDTINYTALISATGNVNATMFNIRTTCYIRVPFTVANVNDVVNLTLRMKYDDGFIAYLNGQLVAQANEPVLAPAYDSVASAINNDTAAVLFEDFDISAFRGSLVNGTNVLAIHGLNQAVNSSDFIILPELRGTAVEAGSPLVTGYYAVPTPGSLNGASVLGFVKDTNFSQHRGLYTSSFTTALTCDTAGAQIRYTTDGSEPTATTGSVYSTPLIINGTTVIRAAAFRAGWQPSNVDTQSYIFPAQVLTQPAAPAGWPTTWGNEYNFTTGLLTGPLVPADYQMDPAVVTMPAYSGIIQSALTDSLPVLSLTADRDAIFGPNGIYANGRLDGIELPASIEFFGPGSGDGFNVRCGLRIHGGDALIEHPKKPFRFYFRKEYGAGTLDFPLYPDSPVSKFNRLQLRGGGHDGWAVPFGGTINDLAWHATYLRDQFLRQTEIDQGRLSPRGRFVHLYINGLYWGFYNLHEVPHDDYFRTHRGGEEEGWDVLEQTGGLGYKIVDGNGDAMDVLRALCTPATRPSDPLIYDQIQRYVNVDDYIDHMILMIWACQNDWMGPVFRADINWSRFFNKNWNTGRLSRGPDSTSFLFSSWDAEISMGTHLRFAGVGHNITDFDHSRVGETGFGGTPGPPAEIYNALRSNPDFRRRFGDRIQKNFFNNGPMTITRNQARMTTLRNTINAAMVPESARWGDVNGPDFHRDDHWTNEMDWMQGTFIPLRNNIVISQFTARTLFPGLSAPNITPFGGNFSAPIVMSSPGGGTIYYTTDGSDPYQPAGPVQAKLITEASACKWWVPNSGVLADTWKNTADPANIGIWSDGVAALGYDTATTFRSHISTDVSTAMQNVNSSIYVRIPFTIPSQAFLDSITAITLRVKYDDGIVAYINGSPGLTFFNGPASPVFDSVATGSRAKIDPQILFTVDYTAQKNRLIVGQNVLAIQGLNITAADADFLLGVELLVTTGTLAEGPSPTAVAYAAPVTLPTSSTVKARALNGGTWSAMTEATYVVGVPATPFNLVVSEVMYDPADPTPAEDLAGYTASDFEYVELYNPTATAVQLQGLKFTAGVEFTFNSGAFNTLAPGGRALIVRNAAAFTQRHGAGHPVLGEFENNAGLANEGEQILLRDAANTPIINFTYQSAAPWPNPPAASGLSIVLFNPEAFPDHASPVSWRLSSQPGGSPGGDDRTDFTAWLTANGASGSELGDFDEDGISNLLEYALGSHPAVPGTGALPTVGSQYFTPGGGPVNNGYYLTITFRRPRAAADLTHTVQFSTDLVDWNGTGVLVDSDDNADGTITETWRATSPVTATQSRYARVHVLR